MKIIGTKMVESIPKNLQNKISILFIKYKTEKFTFQEAIGTLGQNDRYTGQILSSLEKAGWINKMRHSEDRRKRIYQIKDFNEIFDEMGRNI